MHVTSTFVTGTDTDVGKTIISAALLELARDQNIKCVGFKPVASGCKRKDKLLLNEDALLLMSASSLKLDYHLVNPFALELAIAPHIAAEETGVDIGVSTITECYWALLSNDPEFVIVEGAGGWYVPLNDKETLADVCVALNLRVVVVVDMKLGCINHSLLTIEAIRRRDVSIAGWVANSATETMPRLEKNIDTLRGLIDVPCLGCVPHLSEPYPSIVKTFLDIKPLL